MNDNDYMRKYMLNRYNKRIEAAKIKLGNKCSKCNKTDNLQFDHIDRKTKCFTIAKGWNRKESVFWEEINKCQLLCFNCHQEKTLLDLGQISAKTSHGTLSSYRYCKCDLCRKANSENRKQNRLKHKLNNNEIPPSHNHLQIK